MQAATQQLILGYEKLHLSLEDLASEHSISITEVKMMLTQYSSIYRADCKDTSKAGNRDLDFSDDDLDTANQVIRSIVASTDDEHLKFKAAKYIREDKKGRLDINKAIQKIGVDLSTFNRHMQQMRERIAMKAVNAQQPNIVEKEQPVIEV